MGFKSFLFLCFVFISGGAGLFGQIKPTTSPHKVAVSTKVSAPVKATGTSKTPKPDTTKLKPAVISFNQDSGILYIVNNFPLPADIRKITQGYRIQVIATTSRSLAYDTKAKVMDAFPELRTTVIFQPPYYKVRVGDYEDSNLAQSDFRKIKKQFTSAFIVPDQISVNH